MSEKRKQENSRITFSEEEKRENIKTLESAILKDEVSKAIRLKVRALFKTYPHLLNDADDLTNLILEKVLEKKEGFKGEAHWTTWINKFVGFTANNYGRKNYPEIPLVKGQKKLKPASPEANDTDYETNIVKEEPISQYLRNVTHSIDELDIGSDENDPYHQLDASEIFNIIKSGIRECIQNQNKNNLDNFSSVFLSWAYKEIDQDTAAEQLGMASSSFGKRRAKICECIDYKLNGLEGFRNAKLDKDKFKSLILLLW